jgi:hypothetical protein
VRQVSDSVDIRNAAQDSMAITTSAAQSNPLSDGGVYDVSATVDCFVKVAVTANDVTATSGYPLYGGNAVPFMIGAGERIGAITATGSGTLRWHRVAT